MNWTSLVVDRIANDDLESLPQNCSMHSEAQFESAISAQNSADGCPGLMLNDTAILPSILPRVSQVGAFRWHPFPLSQLAS